MTTKTQAKPAAPATVAASTTTAPRVATEAVAPTDIVSVADLREALAAVDATGTYSESAASTLASRTLARYALHAMQNSHVSQGVRVIGSADRTEILRRMWLDAIGRTTAPDKATKAAHPGYTSFGQYLSRYGTVGEDYLYGVEALTSFGPAEVTEAYKAILTARREDKAAADEKAATVAAATAHADYEAWLRVQPQPLREAVALVMKTFTTAPGAAHAEAFITDLQAAFGTEAGTK